MKRDWTGNEINTMNEWKIFFSFIYGTWSGFFVAAATFTSQVAVT